MLNPLLTTLMFMFHSFLLACTLLCECVLLLYFLQNEFDAIKERQKIRRKNLSDPGKIKLFSTMNFVTK